MGFTKPITYVKTLSANWLREFYFLKSIRPLINPLSIRFFQILSENVEKDGSDIGYIGEYF